MKHDAANSDGYANDADSALYHSVAFEDVFRQGQHSTSIQRGPPKEEEFLLPSKNHPASVNNIPRQVNKLYFLRNGNFGDLTNSTANLKKAHESWPQMNPGYRIRYFNLNMARDYLEKFYHPVFLRAFDCIEAFSGKTNLFRMALLYREGGWHSDWKQQCLMPNLLERMSNGTDFFHARSLKDNCAQTALVGARPRHPAIGKFLELMLKHIQSTYYGEVPIDATGPCVFGRGIIESGYQINMDAEFKADKVRGKATSVYFVWKGETVVQHKCEGCGLTHDYGDSGNDYKELWDSKKYYYCQDAESIFNLVLTAN